jgi:iron complex transport system substrate-binding protein
MASLALWSVLLATWPGPRAIAGPKVLSLDQCADQYVLALAPRSDIVGLSYRARDYDSYLAAKAKGLALRRATLESALASRAEIVVRYWGGDELLARRLERRGVKVVSIDDARTFDEVAVVVRKVAVALGRQEAGEALVERMNGELAGAANAWSGHKALYLTSGGYTAGPDTLVGAMMAAASLGNSAPKGEFAPVPLERVVMDPPSGLVLGFFDTGSLQGQGWSIGRHPALARATKGKVLASLPAAVLGCPAWFAADGARDLAGARRGS